MLVVCVFNAPHLSGKCTTLFPHLFTRLFCALPTTFPFEFDFRWKFFLHIFCGYLKSWLNEKLCFSCSGKRSLCQLFMSLHSSSLGGSCWGAYQNQIWLGPPYTSRSSRTCSAAVQFDLQTCSAPQSKCLRIFLITSPICAKHTYVYVICASVFNKIGTRLSEIVAVIRFTRRELPHLEQLPPLT